MRRASLWCRFGARRVRLPPTLPTSLLNSPSQPQPQPHKLNSISVGVCASCGDASGASGLAVGRDGSAGACNGRGGGCTGRSYGYRHGGHFRGAPWHRGQFRGAHRQCADRDFLLVGCVAWCDADTHARTHARTRARAHACEDLNTKHKTRSMHTQRSARNAHACPFREPICRPDHTKQVLRADDADTATNNVTGGAEVLATVKATVPLAELLG